jgi:hypothetical protein
MSNKVKIIKRGAATVPTAPNPNDKQRRLPRFSTTPFANQVAEFVTRKPETHPLMAVVREVLAAGRAF